MLSIQLAGRSVTTPNNKQTIKINGDDVEIEVIDDTIFVNKVAINNTTEIETTVDRIRDRGTMVGKIMIDRDSLEQIVENRVTTGIATTLEHIANELLKNENANTKLISELLFEEEQRLRSDLISYTTD